MTTVITRYVVKGLVFIKIFLKKLFIALVLISVATTSCRTKEYIEVHKEELDSTQLIIMSETKKQMTETLNTIKDLKTTITELSNREETTVIVERDTAGRVVREVNNRIYLTTTKDENIAAYERADYSAVMNTLDSVILTLETMQSSLEKVDQKKIPKGNAAVGLLALAIIAAIIFVISLRGRLF